MGIVLGIYTLCGLEGLGGYTLDDMIANEVEQYVDFEDDSFCFPSDEMFKIAIMSLKDGKALGLDAVPGEVLKCGGLRFLEKFKDLIWRIFSRSYLPVQWRGGRLAELFKKGDAADPDNYRARAHGSTISS